MLRVGKSKLKALAAAATVAAPAVSMAQVNGTWINPVSQTWSLVSNWTGGTIADAGGIATFPASSLTSDALATVHLDTARTLGRIEFTGAFTGSRAYAITGAQNLTLNADTTIQVDSGTHTISSVNKLVSGLMTKTGAGTLIWSGASTFTAGVGAVAINDGVFQASGSNSLRGAVSVTTSNGAALELNNVGSVGSLVLGLGAAGAPNGTLRVVSGTTNATSGFLIAVQTGTINIASGAAYSFGGIMIDSNAGGLNGYVKTGAGTFNLQSTGLGGAIEGTYAQTAGVTSVIGPTAINTINVTGGTFNYAAGSLSSTNPLNVNGGAFNLNAGGSFTGSTIVTAGNFAINSGTHNGNVTVNGGTFTANTARVNSIVTLAGGTTNINGATFSTLNVNGGTNKLVQQGSVNTNAGVLRVSELNIAGGQALDVTNNSMIIDYTGSSPATTLKNKIKSGYNAGAWNGSGLRTSLGGVIGAGSFSGKKAGIGYSEQTDLPGAPLVFKGQNIDNTTLVTKYTFQGDADLDGDVDLDDVIRWSANFTSELGGSGPKFWSQGDWDYDGDVDLDDVILWSANFTSELGGGGLNGAPLDFGAALSSANPDAIGALESLGYSVVPEPTMLGMLGLAGLGFAGRRRRKN